MTEVKDVRAALEEIGYEGGHEIIPAFVTEGLKVCDDYERVHGPVDPISWFGGRLSLIESILRAAGRLQ